MKDLKDILSKMTLEEKCLFLTGDPNSQIAETVGFENLGISSVSMMDGPVGVREYTGKNCVCFPCTSSLASTWNKETAYKAGKYTAREFINNNLEVCLAPGANMKRSPHGGRNFEYFSEDPILGGVMCAEFVNGMQNEGVGTCVKHYAVNNQEFDRIVINAEVDERALRDYYLKSFETVFENSEPLSIMCAYNKVNGVYCAENKYLLTDILRNEWGYDGIVISDWGAVHNSAKSVAAGLDLQQPPEKKIYEQIKKGLEDGSVTEEDIDAAVLRMLKFVKRVKALPKKEFTYNREEQHRMAQELAAEGIVLLKNENNSLPITNKYKKIKVVGRLAEDPMFQGSGAAKINLSDSFVDKPLDFIKAECEKLGIDIVYDSVYNYGYIGAENIGGINSTPKGEFDAIICFVGDNFGSDTETEHWDRDNITYTNYLNGMVHAATKVCDNVIVVMQTGAATIPVRWHEEVNAVVQMWYAGEGCGKAIADVLFGNVNPSGKLSETFILKDRDIDVIGDGQKTWYSESIFVGYRYYDKNSKDVWYPFGHGLSYTEFLYSDLKKVSQGDKIKISLKIKNIGGRAGSETVQMYIGKDKSAVIKPLKELYDFCKIYLEPSEEKTVIFEIENKKLRYYNTSLREYTVESGKYNIYIGSSCADIRLKESFTVEDGSSVAIENKHIMA